VDSDGHNWDSKNLNSNLTGLPSHDFWEDGSCIYIEPQLHLGHIVAITVFAIP